MNAFFECLNSVGNMKNLGIGSNTLPKTNIFASENRQPPKRKGSSSNHPFSGAFAVSFREGNFQDGMIWTAAQRGGPHFLQIHKLLHDLCHYHFRNGQHENLDRFILLLQGVIVWFLLVLVLRIECPHTAPQDVTGPSFILGLRIRPVFFSAGG